MIKWLMPKVRPENRTMKIFEGKNFATSMKNDLPPTFLLNCILSFAFDACRSLSIWLWFRNLPNFRIFSFFLDFFLSFFSVFEFSVFYSISQQFITQQKWSECWDCKMVACVCGSAVSVSLLFRKFSLLSLRGPSLGVRELFFSLPQKWRTLVGG